MGRRVKHWILAKCIIFFLPVLILTGFLSAKAGENTGLYIAGALAENCILNRDDMPVSSYWGQNNVGIISLNTFRTDCVEINRYDWDGNLIEEPAGGSLLRSVRNGEDGYIVSIFADSDRGYASVSIELRKDKALDINKAAHCLCPDCLENAMGQDHEADVYGVGIIDFMTKEIYVLDNRAASFQFGDFYISYYISEHYGMDGDEGIHMEIFYCPRRYG
ncbi:MAG: hypothetical protein HFI89_03660 [Lachnospiraceae bacterium]|nr:hypothetical protein [Lachnospiraceae bacterium]